MLEEEIDVPSTDSSSVTEEVPKVETEENIPFHKHPRWQEVLEDRRQKDAKIAELETQLNSVKPVVEQYQKEHQPEPEIPYWFNGDTKQWKSFNDDYIGGIVNKAEERAFKRIEETTSTRDRQQREAQEWVESNLKALETEFGEIDKNKIIKTALDNDLVDSKGRYNLKAAYFMAKATETQAPTKDTTVQKQIIATSHDRSPEPKRREYRVPSDFQVNRPW